MKAAAEQLVQEVLQDGEERKETVLTGECEVKKSVVVCWVCVCGCDCTGSEKEKLCVSVLSRDSL